MPTVKTLLLAAALLLVLAASAGAATPRVVVSGATTTPAAICGTRVSAQSVQSNANAAIRLTGRKGHLVRQQCVGGKWAAKKKLGRKTALTSDAGDFRFKVRGKRGVAPAYVRFGVGEIVDVPFTSVVQNTNTTIASCASDGLPRTIHGHLTAPRKVLDGRNPSATLLLHGFGYGEFFWRFQAVPGYDAAHNLAVQDHAVVAVDRAGYGASKSPQDGTSTCLGSQADMAHQMSNRLKSGQYALGAGAKPLSFGRVALVGHSAAGAIVELDAASYKDVDAIAEVSYNDSGFTPLTLTQLGAQMGTCLGGAQYAPFGATDADFTTAHLNAPTDPKVAAAVLAMRMPEPCGDVLSATGAVAALQTGAESVGAIPVLDIIGDSDHVFDPGNEALQASRLAAGGATVTKVTVQSAGHGITLGLSHSVFTDALSKWLTDNGF